MGWGWQVVERVERLWTERLSRHALILIVALALVLRFSLLNVPAFHHADEIFQYLEPAHRLVTGYGVVTWEWREGIRSWFLPVLLAGPMALSDWIWPGSLAYLPIIRALTAVASISVVLSFYAIGNGISRTHGLIAAFVAATWFELIYFAVRTLSEPLALALVMPAAAVLWRADQRTMRALLAAGFLLGLAVIVRYQYVAAIGVLVAMTCKLRFRQAWLPVAAGGLAALLLGAAVDLAVGVIPYSWIFNNFVANFVEDRAAAFGEHGPLFYPIQIVLGYWGPNAILILAAAVLAARHYPALFAAALINVVLHSLIGHKEYRFILLSTAIIVLFFSLGVVDTLRHLGERMQPRARAAWMIAAVAWLVWLPITLGASHAFRLEWGHFRGPLRAMQAAHGTENLCGIALFGLWYVETGGYTYLNRPVPVYLFERWNDAPALRQAAPAFNMIIATKESAGVLPPGYVRGACFAPAEFTAPEAPRPTADCVYQRPGICTPGAPEINQTMIDRGL